MQHKLLGAHGLTQASFQRGSGIHHGLHLNVKEAQRIATTHFGLVHRQVCAFQGFLDVFAPTAAKQGNAHAGRAVAFVVVKQVGHVQCGDDLFAHYFSLAGRVRVVLVQVVQHHHKFITSQSCHGVACPHTPAQKRGDALQQQVAEMMAVRVVDDFEVIQIDKQQRIFALVARAGDHGHAHAVHQQASVRQSGQGIKEGQSLDFFL